MPAGTLPAVEFGYYGPNESWQGLNGQTRYEQDVHSVGFDSVFGVSKDTPGKEKKAERAAAPADGQLKGNGEVKPEGAEPAAAESAEAESQEKTEEQRVQDRLREAYESGRPAVVVFASSSAGGTEKLLKTLDQSMKEGKADYIFVDTDKLDPNSHLGQVARRSEEKGQGLGSDGKSDLAFTGVYKVEKTEDGQYQLGKSVATFWGGRPEIAPIMNEHFKYAGRDVSGGGASAPRPPDVPAPAPGVGVDDANIPESGGQIPGASAQNERAEDLKRKDVEQEKQRVEAERKKRVEEISNKGYPLEQYAEGWDKFLERQEMEAGPLRDLTNEFGQQMIMGEFDGKKLQGMMEKIGQTDQASVDATLFNVNKQLADSGLTIRATVNSETGLVNAMEMTGVQAGSRQVSLSVDANGNVAAYEGLGGNRKQAGLEHVSLRLAKQAESDACP